MTADRPTRRGFLAACSAAAAALGLTARAAPARPPIPGIKVPDPNAHARVHYTITTVNGGPCYTSKPTVIFSGGHGSGADLVWKLTKVST